MSTEQLRVVKVIETRVTTYMVRGELQNEDVPRLGTSLNAFDAAVLDTHLDPDHELSGLTLRKECESSQMQVKTEWQLVNDRPHKR